MRQNKYFSLMRTQINATEYFVLNDDLDGGMFSFLSTTKTV